LSLLGQYLRSSGVVADGVVYVNCGSGTDGAKWAEVLLLAEAVVSSVNHVTTSGRCVDPGKFVVTA